MAAQPLRSVVLLVAAGLAVGDIAGPAETAQAAPVVSFTDAPADVVELAEWAIGLFDEAGMELPAVEFRYHGDDTAGCDGEEGLHRPGADGHVIELCRSDVSFATQVTVLHEFAHAWVTHAVDTGARASFQRLRGYERWNDAANTPWYERGTEQAAEIVVWGLIDRPIDVVRINQNSCDDLHAGFVTLAGQPPLHGLRDLCD